MLKAQQLHIECVVQMLGENLLRLRFAQDKSLYKTLYGQSVVSTQISRFNSDWGQAGLHFLPC